MPLASIDLPAGKQAPDGRAVADVVYEAMVATLNAPTVSR
jgi:phenylpyruvate tautomerase PptA (4-oxalocrotonate tautomerase family)